MKNIYPSWRYHRTQPPIIVRSAEEDEALGPEWAATPAAFAAQRAPAAPASPKQPKTPKPPKPE